MYRRIDLVFALLASLSTHAAVVALSDFYHTPTKVEIPPKTMKIQLTRIEEQSKKIELPPKAIPKPKPEPKKKEVVRKKLKKKPLPPKKNKSIAKKQRNPVQEAPAPEPPKRQIPEAPRESGEAKKVKADYTSVVLAWLERHRRYPKIARRRNQEGIGVISITISANGIVERAELIKSSGSASLDRELETIAMRAEPFPAFPKNLREPRLSFTIPIEFKLF